MDPAARQPLVVRSPSGIVQVTFDLRDGIPHYAVRRSGQAVVRPSRLGLAFKEAPPLGQGLRVAAHHTHSEDHTWTTVWGEAEQIRNHYGELRVVLVEEAAPGRRLVLVFRAYDDGVGFRYVLPEQPALSAFEITSEDTAFALAGTPRAWWIPAYRDNRYEYLYACTPLRAVDTVHTPLTMRTEDGLHLSLHEAALTNYASMTLARTGPSRLETDLAPWASGVKVKAQAPLRTPWRTIQMADHAGGLLTSRLILNLNEPNVLDDTSWIAPGKFVGIWWAMHLDKKTWAPGPRHGATTENAKRYIDFAARHGFDGVLVEGWNAGWADEWVARDDEFCFTESYDDFDLEAVAHYARERGVRLIGHHETGGGVENYERQLEEAFRRYEEAGVRTVKTGYVKHGRSIDRSDPDRSAPLREWHYGQYMVRHHQKVREAAARHRLMLDVHEPVRPTGLHRTYPHLMAKEGARGQEFNAWGGGNPPEHTTILPFTRLLGGPMDFTPGIFDVRFEGTRPENRVNTTLAKQLALYVVLFSPLQMAADLPENYEAHPRPFQFIKDVPTTWARTEVLHGQIGDYVTLARQDRASRDWYLGSITDEEGRRLEAPLSFLEPGQRYVAEVYRDAAAAHWKTNPQAYTVEQREVDRSTVLPLRLAPGGGQAIRFRPVANAREAVPRPASAHVSSSSSASSA